MDVIMGCGCSEGDEEAGRGNVDIKLLFVVHVWLLLHNCDFFCLATSFYVTWENLFYVL